MTESTETDPRFHAAYQRGYEGPALERTTRAQERFRRPRPGDASDRRGAAPGGRRRAAPLSEPADVPLRRSSIDQPPVEQGSDEPDTAAVEAPEPTARPRPATAAATRVPLGLAVTGVLFLLLGAGLLYSSASALYYDTGTEFEQFMRAMTSYLPGPAITVGLVSIGAAIAVRAARS